MEKNTHNNEMDIAYQNAGICVRKLLAQHAIDTSSWGKEGKKTVDDLIKEVASGDCLLYEEGGRLVREVYPVGVHIYHNAKQPDGTVIRLKLREAMQVFKDEYGNETDTIRVRDSKKIPTSIAEKAEIIEDPETHELTSEDPKGAAIRGIEEELGIDITQLGELEKTMEDISLDQRSYPGFDSRYKVTQFATVFPDSLFRPNGTIVREGDERGYAYIETQEKKNTYFAWELIDQPKL